MKNWKFIFCSITSLLLAGLCIYAQNSKIDSLQTILLSGNDSSKIKAYLELDNQFASDHPDTIPFFCAHALKLIEAHKCNNEKEEARFHGLKANVISDWGYYYSVAGKNDSALLNYNQAILESKKAGDANTFANTLINRGMIYRIQGDLPLALDDYLAAQKIVENSSDKSSLSALYTNIGRIYDDLNDTAKTLEYLEKGLQLDLKKNNFSQLSFDYTNLGIAESQIDRYKVSIAYYYKALEYLKKYPNKYQEGFTLGQLATSLYSDKQEEKAMLMYSKSISILDSLHAENQLAGLLTNAGKAYFFQGNYDLALQYGLRSFDISKRTEHAFELEMASNLLYLVYKHNGNNAKALEMLEINLNLKDSLLNDKTNKLLVKKQFQFEYEKKSALDEVEYEKEKVIAEEKQRRGTIILYGVSVVLGVVLLFAIFIFRSYRQKQKANLELAEKNSTIESQKRIVEEKQKEILDSIHYAKRIQQSLLPTEKYFNKSLNKFQNKN